MKRYLAAVCMLLFIGSGFAALAATPASTQETGSGGALDTSSAGLASDTSICSTNCSELKQKIRHLESERDSIAVEIRTLKQKEERIAHTIKKIDMAQNDIASNAKRLLGELRVIEKEISILKEKLLRIEHALHALEMERVKLKDMLNDPNLTKEQRTRILTRLAEIDREMKYLKDVAKDIGAHIMRLREVGHKLVEKLKALRRRTISNI